MLNPSLKATDPFREYIAAGDWTALSEWVRVLPKAIDDLQAEVGTDIYTRMIRDDAVSSAVQILKLAVLADGIRLEPALDIPEDPSKVQAEDLAKAERAAELKEFVQEVLDRMDTPIRSVAKELLDGVSQGFKLAEIVYQVLEDGPYAGKFGVARIKPKPRANVGLVTDAHGNLLGAIGRIPERPAELPQIMPDGNPEAHPGWLPLEKFLLFVHAPQDGDPRGTSQLRPAYKPWFVKSRRWPSYDRYLEQFATPAVVGKTPVDQGDFVPAVDATGAPVTDAEGAPTMVSAEAALLMALQKFANGTALAVKGGSEVDVLYSQGDGQAHINAFDLCDRAIYRAILGTARSTMEAKNSSQSDAGAAQDILGLVIADVKQELADCLNQLVRHLMALNFADAEDRALAPSFALSQTEPQDLAKMISAVAAAFGAGMIHESQLPGLDSKLGLPERDLEQIAREKEEAALLERQAAQDAAKLFRPGATLPPDEDE